MICDLHGHSNHSRGSKLPREALPNPADMIREAKRKGIGAFALTDHNVITGWSEAKKEAKKQGVIFIPGIELNTADGHLLGLGLTERVPRDLSIEETIDLIHQQGGIAIAPHPFDIKNDGVGEKFRKADAAEVWSAMNLDRFANWVMRQKIGTHPAVAGSDAHTLGMIGNGRNEIAATSLDGILKEIKAGRVTVRGRYPQVREIRLWAHQRFVDSEGFVREYMQQNYSPFTNWLSQRMLTKFLKHDEPSAFFVALGWFGIGCSYGYGAVKAITRF